MDELLHHCLRELAFDGDLGSNPSRLSDFIIDFYGHGTSQHTQQVDDDFCAFVWSFVVQQSNILVGTKPPGVTSEVWVAPQTSAKRKANAKGQVLVQTTPAQLDIITDAKSRPLVDLVKEHGEDLRIAVEPDSIYAAVTGSHIRFPKLSPMVYSALQIVTRGRDSGVSVVELGQKSKYDQKTCFYLVKQLTDLDLVVKVRRGGVGTHFVIHKYFFDRSASWKAIREEESQAKVEDVQAGNDAPEEDSAEVQGFNFTAIDARHLSSLPLVRGRVVKLLKASKNYIHPSNNMIITIGFKQPTKTDRRFFQSRIREMIQEGIIEKVTVPNRKKNMSNSVTCFRLLDENANKVVKDLDVEGTLADDSDEPSGIKVNTTIHKLIIDHLEDAGITGMTLNELSSALCNFDKRTIELLLTRAEKCPPPEHLSDLGISGLMETNGRERRHRYFTVSAYHKLVSKENLDKPSAGLPNIDWDDTGGFSSVDEQALYSDIEAMEAYQDEYKEAAESAREAATGQPRKKASKNPTLPDGTIKKGRPKTMGGKSKLPKTRKRKQAEEGSTEDSPVKRRKTSRAPNRITGDQEGQDGLAEEIEDPRAKKIKIIPKAKKDVEQPQEMDSSSVPNRRGPRKAMAGKGKDHPTPSKEQFSRPARLSRKSKGALSSDEEPPTIPIEAIPQVETEIELAASDANMTVLPSDAQFFHRDFPALCSCPSTPIVPSETAEHGISHAQEETCAEPSFDHGAIDSAEPNIPIDPLLLGNSLKAPISRSPIRPQQTPLGKQALSVLPNSKAQSVTNRRVNVSHLRRENELFRVIEILGGIANTQTKEMFDAHTALLERLVRAGEATSAPVGTRTDKRTAVATLNSLESQGRIKQMKTMLLSPAGVGRPTVIVYLPDTPPERVNAFLAELARGQPPIASQPATFKKIDDPLEYGPDPTLVHRSNLPLQLLQMDHTIGDEDERIEKNMARLEELFAHDDDTIREVLLTERTTLGQMYGSVVAKALRAKELHRRVAEAFEERHDSPQIVSHDYRILSLSYFCFDLPLKLYCSLLSPLFHHEQLTRFLADKETQSTLVHELPQSLRSILQIGKSRARSRFLDILELLRCLGLVIPLIESSTSIPYIRLSGPAGDHPTAFDRASMEGWTVSTPTTAPMYWQFKTLAPLYHWAAAVKSPPLLRTLSVSNLAEVLAYWDALHEACLDNKLESPTNTIFAPVEDSKVARSLRRSVSWNPNYIFTWHQTRYMHRFVNVTTGATPLGKDDGGVAEIEKISHIISAPKEAIADYYASSHQKMMKDIGKMRRKKHNDEAVEKKNVQDTAQAKALLAKRAAEARLLREQEWSDLVNKVHPELSPHATVRLRRIQKRFLDSVHKETDNWEAEIRKAFEDSEAAAAQVLKHAPQAHSRVALHHHHSIGGTSLPPTIDSGASEKTIHSLIAEQGPPISAPPRRKKRKRKDRDDDSAVEDIEAKVKLPQRRHRFQWNRDYEELARDACVIIKARCRNGVRLDWGAFEQVFPAVPRNSVRQRMTHIRETPGNDAYLNRLEDRWYEMWMKHRGSQELPDDDFNSATNFDLIAHIEFLRKHIDKNAIRVGYAQPQGTISGDFVIPHNVEDLAKHFDVQENVPGAPTWDFMWYGVVEEEREKKLASTPFTKLYGELMDQPSANPLSLAESALKMALGTLGDHYEAEAASNFLRSAANDVTISTATKGLLSRGVFSKLVRDHHRQKPGRQLKISDANQTQLSGPVSSEIFQDAAGLEESFVMSEFDAWREWPLLATDGDTAALIQMTSDNKLDFKVDTSNPQAARPGLDWNSKKADDDQIETSVFVRYLALSRPTNQSCESPFAQNMEMDVNPLSDVEHGQTVDGSIACCRRTCSEGVIDCTGCLDEQWAVSSTSLSESEMSRAQLLLWVVGQAGDKGATKLSLVETTQATMDELMPIIQKLSDGPLPLLFWMGYTSPLVLVSAAHIRSWTVTLPSDAIFNIFPRRWIDISGSKLMGVWGAAVRAVVGTIVIRPGISQCELRWRLKTTYDRQEVYDILQYLLDDGHVRTSVDGMDAQLVPALDELEESEVFYFVSNSKKWYQV